MKQPVPSSNPKAGSVVRPLPTRAGIRMRRWLGNLIVFLAFLGLITEGLIPQADLGIPMTILCCSVAGVAVVWVGLLGRRLAMTSRKQEAVLFAHTRAADPRPPVLYLRSFADDAAVADANLVDGFLQLSTEEEQFAKVLNAIGPFTAIGKPGETLPTLGAARHYDSNDAWQEDVQHMLARAKLVVLRLSTTPGLRWEIDQVFNHVDPSRILLLVPRTNNYAVLKDVSAHWLPTPLPALPKFHTIIGSLQGIVRFHADWTPEFLPVHFALWRASLRSPLAPHLQSTLRPVFEQTATPWAKPGLGCAPLTMAIVLGLGLLWTAVVLISNG